MQQGIGCKFGCGLIFLQTEILQTLKNHLKATVHFPARQRRTQAMVYAFAKGDVIAQIWPSDIKASGVFKLRFVLIRRCEASKADGIFWNGHAMHLHIAGSAAEHV